jgi:DNA polymerase/3'-5' exonuclease PolX
LKNAVKYCDDLKATHSVTEIANIETIIRAEFPEFIFTIVGAYRRNQPADQIHVVIKSTADTDIHSMVQKLKDIKLILDDLKQSTSTHYEGACKIDTDKCTLIILDIVSSISYIPTVFNLTGNEEFVKVAVQSASNVDLSLTPVSLQDSNGGNMFINVDLVELFDEKELFTKIELDWMEPCDRSW